MAAGFAIGTGETVRQDSTLYETLKLSMNMKGYRFTIFFGFFYPGLIVLFDDLIENGFLRPSRFVNRWRNFWTTKGRSRHDP
jgi:hypothetical protein